MLVDTIQKSVLDEEFNKVCYCECCELEKAEVIYLVKQGICTVISHVCTRCRSEIEAEICKQSMEYQFILKINMY